MTDPIKKDDPLSSREEAGKRLFDHAVCFYAEYATWDARPGEKAKNLKNLSIIMRIASVATLTSLEEEKAIGLFAELRDGLQYGTVRSGEIADKLTAIRRILTERNARSNVIGHVMELDYRNRIRPNAPQSQPLSQEILELVRKTLDHIVDQIKSAPETHAKAITQELSVLLAQPISLENLISALKTAIKTWL